MPALSWLKSTPDSWLASCRQGTCDVAAAGAHGGMRAGVPALDDGRAARPHPQVAAASEQVTPSPAQRTPPAARPTPSR